MVDNNGQDEQLDMRNGMLLEFMCLSLSMSQASFVAFYIIL